MRPPFNEGNNQTVLSGFPATLSVTLADIPGYQFVWKKDGSVVNGETARALSFASAAPADSGAYTLEITFDADTVIAGPTRLIVPAVPTTDYATRVLANNPFAYWRLNDPDQSPTIDDERNALNNSQFFIDVDYQRPGALLGDANAAVAFRGTVNSKGEVFIDNELSTPQFSVELWARRTGGDGTFTSPLTFRDFNDTAVPPYRKGWLFYATDANRWQFRIGDGTATWVSIDGPPVVNGEWTQLAGTYNGTEVAFYVNGALVESRVAGYAPIDPAQLPPLLRIGGGSTEDENGDFFFTGSVDEVAVYTSALTGAQVADHWAAAFSPTIAPVIDGQPQPTEVVLGGSVTLAVQARSATPLSYQWKKGGAALDGETAETLILAGADAASAGDYTVDVTNSAGTTTSQAAAVTVVGPEASYEATILRDEPVAYWRLGETAGTTAADAMGNHPGAYGTGIALGEIGALDGDADTAARFTQATASFVEVPWSAALNAPQFTFECWAKVTGGTSYRSPMTSRADAPQRGFIFYATPANVWEFWTGPGWNTLGSAPVQNDTWVYLAGTHDGSTKRFFVNGQQVGSNQSAFSPNDASVVLRIGGGATESPTGDFFFEGLIDEAAVYDRALSPARILTHYLAGQPPVEEIVVAIAIEGGEIVISWEGVATLQETADIAGSWNDLVGASSPFRVTPAGNLKFWRLRNP